MPIPDDSGVSLRRKDANKPYPAAIVPAAQNMVFGQEQLARLRAEAFAAVADEGQTSSLVDGGAEGDESPGTHLTLYEKPRRGPEPSPLARAWWETFVLSGCLARVTAQVEAFLRARKSPVALLPKFPSRAFLFVTYSWPSRCAVDGFPRRFGGFP